MNHPNTMRGLVPDSQHPLSVRLHDAVVVPKLRRGEILVRVTHTTVNGHEFTLSQHPMVRAAAVMLRARGQIRTGLEFAGIVTSDGSQFRKGDRVMGYVEMLAGPRPHAEYVAIPEAFVAAVPNTVSMAEASTLPMSGLTALAAVRDVAALQPGQRVLITGATGGVGVQAVQLARLAGAVVTAVASSAHHEVIRSLGASHVVDYRDTPIPELDGPFDAILEFSDTLRLRDVSHLLAPEGVFVPADPLRNLVDIGWCRQARYLMVSRGETEGLAELASLVDDGRLRPVVDRTYSLSAWTDAIERGHARGRLGRTVLCFEASGKQRSLR